MTDWADQLINYGLEYEPSWANKAHALAHFITECSTRPPVGEKDAYELQVDDSSTKTGCGAGLVIKPLIGKNMDYASKFEFLRSNDEARYEAHILKIQLCIWAGATIVKAKCDSQLIVSQVLGEYKAQEDNMRMYFAKTQEIIKKLS